ncbi:MAG: DotU family type IV/VI secretion system protein [Phycisphaerales bacterium JB059]
MTSLPELCEPLFQYVCRLSRSSRKGVALDPGLVRSDVRALMGELSSRARAESGMSALADEVRVPLALFVDETVRHCVSGAEASWRSLADELEGFEVESSRFFTSMEDALGDMSQGGLQRVEVLQTCLGLGYRGGRTPGEIASLIERGAERLSGRMDADPSARVCPEAYDHVDTSDLIQPAGRSVLGIGIALVTLIVVVAVGNAIIYKTASGELRAALRGIERAIGGE